jgi:uncharacterized membrane protein YedE/YeeE
MTDSAVRHQVPLSIQWPAAIPALLLLGGGAIWLAINGGHWKYGALFMIGGMLGVALYHAAFGFTAAYRNAFVRRNMGGVKAQILMVGLAIILFAPVMAGGKSMLGGGVIGGLAPVGWEVLVGSFIFGVGMQLGGACGSGTLFTVGGGSVRMMVTLVFFCLGAFLATLHGDLWQPLRTGSTTVALGREFGWSTATAGQLALLAAIWYGVTWAGRGRTQNPLWTAAPDWRRLLGGPWPLLISVVVLALGNWLILAITGHAWSITWGFTLWAAEIAQALGWDPASSPFWVARAKFLARGIFVDDTSITNIGIILGALLAAGLGGRVDPIFKVPAKSLLAAIIGGLLLGIGARMAYGCNIGAFFSGVASSSLHGWVWLVGALVGNWFGTQLRPTFGLEK